MEKRFDKLIVSDLHLGLKISREEDLIDLIEKTDFNELVLAGDIFDSQRNIGKKIIKFVERLNKIITDKKSGIVWVRGNNEERFNGELEKALSIKFQDQHSFVSGGKKIVVLHGHQFKILKTKIGFVKRFLRLMYFLFRFSVTDRFFRTKFQKRIVSGLNVADRIGQLALSYAKEKGFDSIICGHIHLTDSKEDGGVSYYNLGNWFESPSYYALVKDGEIIIKKY